MSGFEFYPRPLSIFQLLPLETTFAGLRSSPIPEAVSMLENSKSIITERRNVAVSGELRYNYRENPKLTSEFILNLCDLPVEYDAEAYQRFLATWGTHVIVAVKIGRMDVTRYEIPLARLNAIMATTAGLTKLLHVNTVNSTAWYGSESFQEQAVVQTFIDLTTGANSTFRKWHFTAGSLAVPSPVHLTLRRLDKFVTQEILDKSMGDGGGGTLCPRLDDRANVAWIRSNVRQALLEYPVEPATKVFSPLRRDFKIDWPKGD